MARLDQSQEWLDLVAVAEATGAMPTVAQAALDILVAAEVRLEESAFPQDLLQGLSPQVAQAAAAICSSSQCKENQ